MHHFKAINKTTRDVVEYDATLPQPEHLTTDWRLENLSEASSTPDPEADPAPMVAMVWTKLEYLRRFTQSERIGIRDAAKVVPELFDYMELLALAEEIRSDDPDIAAALAMLEGAGLIAAGRAQEILNAQ